MIEREREEGGAAGGEHSKLTTTVLQALLFARAKQNFQSHADLSVNFAKRFFLVLFISFT